MEPKPGDLLKIRFNLPHELEKFAYVIFIGKSAEYYADNNKCFNACAPGCYTLLNMNGIHKTSVRTLQKYFEENYEELCVLRAPDDALNSPGS
jgi:hypothetical protein